MQKSLDLAEFKDAVRKGMGRAVLATTTSIEEAKKEVILEACRNDQRYDRQCEDERTGFLIQLLDRAGLLEEFKVELLQSLEPSSDDWEHLLRVRLLGKYARQGDEEALNLLRSYSLELNYDAIAVLENLGLEEVSWLTMQVLPQMPDDEKWRVHYWLEGIEDVPDHIATAVTKANQESDAYRESHAGPQRTIPTTFEEALANVQGDNLYCSDLMRLPSMTEDQAILVAQLWLEEKNFRRASNYILLFRVQEYPLPVEGIIERVNAGNPPRRYEEILANLEHPGIRDLGLQLISQPSPDWRGFESLRISFLDEDIPLLYEAAKRSEGLESQELHQVIGGIRDLGKEMTSEQRLPFLIWAYEQSPCAMCRAMVVATMVEDGTLPDDYRQELPYDADDYARKLVADST